MADHPASQREYERREVKGALDVLFTLREELAQWLEEAQDESKQEALENVLAHIESMEETFKARQQDLAR